MAPSAAGALPRVLVVEDNAINRTLARSLFARLGLTIDMACDGVEAVLRVADTAYDVIFMDMQMPNMDGVQATRAIRQMALPTQPYIIALTGNTSGADRLLCKQAGMDDFLGKPYLIADLRAKLAGIPLPAAHPDSKVSDP